jgi:hypothetical protein
MATTRENQNEIKVALAIRCVRGALFPIVVLVIIEGKLENFEFNRKF